MPIELPVNFTFPNVATASKQALQKLDQNVRGSTVGLKDIAKTAAVVAGAFIAAGAAVKGFLDNITDVIDEANTLAAATGLTAESIQGLRQAAKASGKALKDIVPVKLAKNLLAAQQGSTELARAFKQIGVAFKDAEGNVRDINEAFPDLLDKLAAMENRTEAAGLAAQLMGKQGRELLSAFSDSTQFNAFVAQAREFGIGVGPAATKASEDWQKANANLGLSFTFVARSLLDAVGGQEALNIGINNAAVNIVFLTETIKVFFAEFKKGLIIETARFGELARQIKEFATTGSITIKPIVLDIEAPLELIEILQAGVTKAKRFRELLEDAAKGGSKGFRGITAEVKALGKSLEDIAGLFDLSGVINADIALSKILNSQWEAQASAIDLINADFDKQKALIEDLVKKGANRVGASVALAQIEVDRIVALSEERGLLSEIADIDERRKENAQEALSIAQEATGALQASVGLATEIWRTNQANNRELENELRWLKQSTKAKTEGLELDLEDLESQLELASTAKEISTIETAIADTKEQIAVIDEDADKRAKTLKKREEERLEDTFKDIKAFQIASTIAAGATAAVVAIAQLGPVAGAAAVAGIVATTIAASLATIRSQAPSFHIGGNPFEGQPLPGFSRGPDERQVTVTANEIQSPADLRGQQERATVFELPIVLSNQVIDKLVYEVATGTGKTGRLIRGGTDVLRRPAFTGN